MARALRALDQSSKAAPNQLADHRQALVFTAEQVDDDLGAGCVWKSVLNRSLPG